MLTRRQHGGSLWSIANQDKDMDAVDQKRMDDEEKH